MPTKTKTPRQFSQLPNNRHRSRMRRLPKRDGLPGDRAGPLRAAARLRPADGAHGHQRDGGEGRRVPPQMRPSLRAET